MSYYSKEYKVIDPSSASIELKDDKGNKTRVLSLNQEAAQELIKWIEDNFVKLKK
jgi:site-specific recombinase XerD